MKETLIQMNKQRLKSLICISTRFNWEVGLTIVIKSNNFGLLRETPILSEVIRYLLKFRDYAAKELRLNLKKLMSFLIKESNLKNKIQVQWLMKKFKKEAVCLHLLGFWLMLLCIASTKLWKMELKWWISFLKLTL